MKRLISLLLVLCLFVCLLPSGALAEGTANLTVTTTAPSAVRGGEITFVAAISENSGFNSITNMRLDYDPAVFQFVSVDVVGTLLSAATVNHDTGLISYAVTDPVTTNGTLFKATFRVLRSAPVGNVSVGVAYDYFRVSTSDTAFADVNPVITPCSVKVIAGEGGYERIAGERRTETAAAISSECFESADNVILANGDNFADALAGVSLAYAMDAPILLVRKSKLDDATLEEIDRLKAKTVTILGGAVAISDAVRDTLESRGYRVERIAGEKRFQTAVLIAKALQAIKGTPSELFFVVSDNFPDALAVSNVAALMGCPVLYIAPKGTLDSATEAYLQSCGVKKATIIGGTTAINGVAEGNIASALGIHEEDVARLSGDNRYKTCILINETYASTLTGRDICVATGTNYPDALAGGVFAARHASPMLLVSTSIKDFQKTYLGQIKPEIVYVFGGPGAVSDDVAKAVVAASK